MARDIGIHVTVTAAAARRMLSRLHAMEEHPTQPERLRGTTMSSNELDAAADLVTEAEGAVEALLAALDALFPSMATNRDVFNGPFYREVPEAYEKGLAVLAKLAGWVACTCKAEGTTVDSIKRCPVCGPRCYPEEPLRASNGRPFERCHPDVDDCCDPECPTFECAKCCAPVVDSGNSCSHTEGCSGGAYRVRLTAPTRSCRAILADMLPIIGDLPVEPGPEAGMLRALYQEATDTLLEEPELLLRNRPKPGPLTLMRSLLKALDGAYPGVRQRADRAAHLGDTTLVKAYRDAQRGLAELLEEPSEVCPAGVWDLVRRLVAATGRLPRLHANQEAWTAYLEGLALLAEWEED